MASKYRAYVCDKKDELGELIVTLKAEGFEIVFFSDGPGILSIDGSTFIDDAEYRQDCDFPEAMIVIGVKN